MVGYYKNPDDSQQILTDDGFIRTGDLAEITSDGWLKITGRIKEQFKTAKGKYVVPSKIEALLGMHPAIENCLVLGTNKEAPSAIAVLTGDAMRRASTEAGRGELEKSFEELIEKVNSKVEVHERLAHLILVHDHWTIDSGFITPTLKLKRFPLEAHYSPLISAAVEQGKRVVWSL